MLFGAGTGAASTVSGPFSPVLTALVLKYGSSILSNPKYLKTFTLIQLLNLFPYWRLK